MKYFWTDVKFFLGPTIFAVAIIMIASIPVYIGAGHQAKILNEKYGTEYTTSDMFWAGETIKTVVVGTQHNIKLDMEEK